MDVTALSLAFRRARSHAATGSGGFLTRRCCVPTCGSESRFRRTNCPTARWASDARAVAGHAGETRGFFCRNRGRRNLKTEVWAGKGARSVPNAYERMSCANTISQAPEQNDWKEFKPLFGGGKIKVCDTLRAVTPFGGLSVFIEFFGRVGLVEQLANGSPLPAQKRQSLRSRADPGGLHLECHCRRIAFCPEISYGLIALYTRCLG